MTRLQRLFPLLLAVPFLATSAAADEPKKAEPADRKAYTEASKISDPQAKIDAYRKLINDYKKSPYVSAAQSGIFETTAANFPDRTAEINSLIAVQLKHAKGQSKASREQQIASTLAENNIMLDRAEGLASKSLRDYKESDYAAMMKKSYARSKLTPPTDARLHINYVSDRARYLQTLGEIDLKEGKADEGRKLLEEAHKDNPLRAAVSADLADLALKGGDEDAAYNYLLQARLTGIPKPEHREKFRELYRKGHGGTLDGYDDLLDSEYAKMFPDPFHADEYKAPASRSDRVALVEIFTGSGCPPCVGADVAMDQVLDRYSRHDVSMLVFHQQYPHPDPMANPSSVKRADFYDVHGVPTLVIDGVSSVGGSSREECKAVYDRINPMVEKELVAPAEASIALNVSREGNLIKVHATADGVQASADEFRLQVMLVELRLRYTGENSIRFHPMVVRDIANLADGGFPLHPGETAQVDHSFDVAKISADLKSYLEDFEQHNEDGGKKFTYSEKKDVLEPSNLAVVAFVQNVKTKHVLQSSYVAVSGASPSSGR
jgi:hypothetical protein